MSQFVEFLDEVFETFGEITVRKMFGGYGVYHQGIMFALVADDQLYLKVDQSTRHKFEEKGLSAFQYQKNDKQVNMSYFLAPEEIYDDKEQAAQWAAVAFGVAKNRKRPKRKVKQ
ncbi:MAG: TfoX/Sxy family protein [Gammaproteobacteria bacterium]|nr:TfoX/Sxy family protein [Gammaproteobacteria bacterium]